MSFTIYLAGGKSDWRTKLARRWDRKYGLDVTAYDPFKDSRQGATFEFTNDDLAAVASSDLVFGFTDYPVYTGVALEFGYAYGLEIPIIYATTLPRIDSMMVGVAKASFTDFNAARGYIEERYLDSKEGS